MKPFFKYPGGKAGEIKTIKTLLPKSFTRVVEPFVGGGAVSWWLEKPALINDINDNVSNVYEIIKDEKTFEQLIKLTDTTNITTDEEINVKHLEKLYYQQRDGLFGTTDPLQKAYRFLILRQLAFSGMYRINSKTGKFNVPFGWYKKFNTNLSIDHHKLVQSWDINNTCFSNIIPLCEKDDFLFLDPPYLSRNSEYGTGGTAGETTELHEKLASQLKETAASWLLVHVDHELYRELYRDFDIVSVDFTYKQNFKGRQNGKEKVSHLYIRNYKPSNKTALSF